jgi:hypothetical protein
MQDNLARNRAIARRMLEKAKREMSCSMLTHRQCLLLAEAALQRAVAVEVSLGQGTGARDAWQALVAVRELKMRGTQLSLLSTENGG